MAFNMEKNKGIIELADNVALEVNAMLLDGLITDSEAKKFLEFLKQAKDKGDQNGLIELKIKLIPLKADRQKEQEHPKKAFPKKMTEAEYESYSSSFGTRKERPSSPKGPAQRGRYGKGNAWMDKSQPEDK